MSLAGQDPIVICVAPNGARRRRTDHPGIPLTAEDLAYEAALCRDAGAAMIHTHVRDARGGHVLDADVYGDVIRAIRREVGGEMIIQISTEAMGQYEPAQQAALVKAVRPEAASVALRELVPNEDAVEEAEALFHHMADHDVMTQYILHTPVEVRRFNGLRARGVIPGDKPSVQFVLGSYAGGPGHVADLASYLTALQEGGPCHWSVCAFGVTEAQAARWAMEHGGHPRVGFENNLMLESGVMAINNAALVTQTVFDAHLVKRAIVDAQAARLHFGQAEKSVRFVETPQSAGHTHAAVLGG